MKTTSLSLLFALLLPAGPVAAGQIRHLATPDALATRVEGDPGALAPLPSPLGWQDKLSPLMWQRAAAGGTQRVLVLLQEPALVSSPERGDALRVHALAAVEQGFVERTAPHGLRPVKGLSHLPIVIADVPVAALADIAADPMVRAIDPDIRLHAHRAEGGALISSPQLRSLGGNGSGIVVAIFDSGIDWTHSELDNDKVIAWADYTDTDSETPFDDNGHGTACAGIVAGDSGGMAPAAKLWGLKVLDSEGNGDFSDTVTAINDVVASLGPSALGAVHAVSMSIGSSTQMPDGNCDSAMPTMTTAMQALANKGIMIFVSSGNDGCTGGVGFPSCVSYATSVGAVYDATLVGRTYGEGTCTPGGCSDFSPVADQITCYSNSGNRLDMLAPSHDCVTPDTGGGYKSTFGGTSAACPYAAGVAAQILSKLGAAGGQGELEASAVTAAQVRTAMMNTGTLITDARNGVARRRIDAMAAYQYLTGGGGGGGTNTYWIPVVANAGGAGGTYFYSDIAVLNAGAAATTIGFTYYYNGTSVGGTSTQPVSAGGQGIFRDIVGQLSRPGTKGTMKVEASQPLKVTSRTYNKLAAGNSLGLAAGTTFGQFIDAYTLSDTLSTGQVAYLPGLTENASYRTNVAVANFGASTASVTVALYNGSGSFLTSYPVSLAPGALLQENQPFLTKAGQSNLESGWAKVTVNSGSGVVCYASVLDNVATGGQKPSDPTTIPMKR